MRGGGLGAVVGSNARNVASYVGKGSLLDCAQLSLCSRCVLGQA
jgi:hypothetical protein